MSDPTPSKKPLMIELLHAAWDTVCGSSEAYGIDDDVTAMADSVRDALDELATLRARVAELVAWRERAEGVLREVAQVQEDVVAQGRDPGFALDVLDHIIDDLAPEAFALLGEDDPHE